MTTTSNADGLFSKGNYQGALRLYLERARDHPEDISTIQKIAECHYRLGNYDGALDSSRAAIAIDTQLAVPHTILAYVYYHRGKHDDSVAEAQKAYGLAPELPDTLDCYGTILLAGGRISDAIPLLEKAVELEPSRLSARTNLSIAYKVNKNRKKYLEQTWLAFKIKPSAAYGLRLLDAYQLRYAVPLSLMVTAAMGIAIIFKIKLLLLPPAYVALRGLWISYQFARDRKLRMASVHFAAYLLFAILIWLIYVNI
jgi:tetratricopeptide (TPR) repeat protein